MNVDFLIGKLETEQDWTGLRRPAVPEIGISEIGAGENELGLHQRERMIGDQD